MFNALLKMEFKRHFLGMLAWTLTLSILMLLIVLLYPLIEDLYANLPAEFIEILNSFGGIPNDVLEYYATEAGFLYQVFGSVYAILLGYNLVSAVEKEKTAEVLYTQPIPRKYFYFSRLLILLGFLFIFCLGNYLIVYFGFLTTGSALNHLSYFNFSILNFVMLVYIGLIGHFIACIVSPKSKSMVTIAIPITLYVIYIIALATDTEWLKNLRYLSPFTFSDPVEILKTSYQFEWISFTIYTIIVLIMSILGYFFFKKRHTII